MKNMNIKENPVTTILGWLLVTVALCLLITPYFHELKEPVELSTVAWIGGIGLSFLLIPDDVIGALRKIIAKKTDFPDEVRKG